MKGQTGHEMLHSYSIQKTETWQNINAVTAPTYYWKWKYSSRCSRENAVFCYRVMGSWGSGADTIHEQTSFTAISPHHFVQLMNKILKRCLFSEAGSGEVLCWHLGCLFTSHSRPLRGCFWLSAAIWNANGFLSAQLQKFFFFPLSPSSVQLPPAHRFCLSSRLLYDFAPPFHWAAVYLAAWK